MYKQPGDSYGLSFSRCGGKGIISEDVKGVLMGPATAHCARTAGRGPAGLAALFPVPHSPSRISASRPAQTCMASATASLPGWAPACSRPLL